MTELVTWLKQAARPELSYDMHGTLYVSKSGWLLMQIPNDIGRGAFTALKEPTAELPLGSNGRYNAHISVMTAEEVEELGGPDKIKERGQSFSYTTGPVRTVKPRGWGGVSKVWFIECYSPELRQLRRSYGLASLPHGDHEFHCTFAVRRKVGAELQPADRAGQKAAHFLAIGDCEGCGFPWPSCACREMGKEAATWNRPGNLLKIIKGFGGPAVVGTDVLHRGRAIDIARGLMGNANAARAGGVTPKFYADLQATARPFNAASLPGSADFGTLTPPLLYRGTAAHKSIAGAGSVDAAVYGGSKYFNDAVHATPHPSMAEYYAKGEIPMTYRYQATKDQRFFPDEGLERLNSPGDVAWQVSTNSPGLGRTAGDVQRQAASASMRPYTGDHLRLWPADTYETAVRPGVNKFKDVFFPNSGRMSDSRVVGAEEFRRKWFPRLQSMHENINPAAVPYVHPSPAFSYGQAVAGVPTFNVSTGVAVSEYARNAAKLRLQARNQRPLQSPRQTVASPAPVSPSPAYKPEYGNLDDDMSIDLNDINPTWQYPAPVPVPAPPQSPYLAMAASKFKSQPALAPLKTPVPTSYQHPPQTSDDFSDWFSQPKTLPTAKPGVTGWLKSKLPFQPKTAQIT